MSGTGAENPSPNRISATQSDIVRGTAVWKPVEAFDARHMRAANSLSVKVIEPLTRYSIRYDNEGFGMDLVREAIGPLHELKTGDPAQQQTAKFHIEQPGRMRGTIRRDGREFAIDCFSMRDTSYGARDYASLASGGYFWGIAADSAFHAIAKGEGSEQQVIGGFIWKDGELVSLRSGTRRVTEYGKYGPRRFMFEATDKKGRTIAASGTVEDGLIFTGYSDHTVVWSLVEFRRIARGEIVLG
jgi:hypothetical protein